MSDRESAIDAVLMWWLNGTDDESMRAWWSTGDAHDTAAALVDVVMDSLNQSQHQHPLHEIAQLLASGGGIVSITGDDTIEYRTSDLGAIWRITVDGATDEP